MKRLLMLSAFALSLAACKEEVAGARPDPAPLADEQLGHYCQMYVADHPGPKAQIHLEGYDHPMWFGQVSDAIAYLSDPERDAPVTAFYVTDMARAENWAVPGEAAWIDGEQALFLIESARRGGMGMPEAIPFAGPDGATPMMAEAGGRLVPLADVPEAYVRPDLGQVSMMKGHP